MASPSLMEAMGLTGEPSKEAFALGWLKGGDGDVGTAAPKGSCTEAVGEGTWANQTAKRKYRAEILGQEFDSGCRDLSILKFSHLLLAHCRSKPQRGLWLAGVGSWEAPRWGKGEEKLAIFRWPQLMMPKE